MSNCLFCVASDIERSSWLRIHYNSSRSNDEQSVRGKVTSVVARKDGSCKVKIRRKDDQRMTVHEDGKLVSHGSHRPITGYAFRYEVKSE